MIRLLHDVRPGKETPGIAIANRWLHPWHERCPPVGDGALGVVTVWTRSAVLGALLCVLLGMGLGLPQLAARPLLDAEARYASIGQNMFMSGDWVVPRLNKVRYYEKPPLYYWAIAAGHQLLGAGEQASRLPGALAYIGTVLAVYVMMLPLYGVGAAVCAGVVTATSVGPFYFARTVLPDLTLTFFTTVSLLGLTSIARHPRSLWPPFLFYCGAACAGLTKGLVGVFIPFATAGIYGWSVGLRKLWRDLHPVFGMAVMLAVALPWHVAMAVHDAAFVPFYVLNEHVYRFLNIREPIDYVPLSIPGFWTASGFWLLPWLLFLPAALAWAWKGRRQVSILLIWPAVVLGFFSLARSRLEKYGLPAIPALAGLIGAYWYATTQQRRRSVAALLPAVLLISLGCGMAMLAFGVIVDGDWLTALLTNLDGHYRDHREEAALLLTSALALARPFSLFALGLGVAALYSAWTVRNRLTFVVWAVFAMSLMFFVDQGGRLLGPERSLRDAAVLMERHWDADAAIVVAGQYEDAMSLGYYVHHPIAIIDGRSTDLAFGFRQGDAPDLVMSDAQLQEVWNSPRRVFLIAYGSTAPAGAVVLLERPTYALVTNRPLRTS